MESFSNAHISFEKICKNREYYVPGITGGYPVLMDIINWCIDRYLLDQSIKTYMCYKGCQTDIDNDFQNDSFIMFNVVYNNEKYIYSILNLLNSFWEVKYMIGQQRIDNTMLLDVKYPYFNEEKANDFFTRIKEALINADKVKSCSPEVENMVKLLKEVYMPEYCLIFQHTPGEKYSALYSPAISSSIINRPSVKEETFDRNGIIKLKANHFMGRY